MIRARISAGWRTIVVVGTLIFVVFCVYLIMHPDARNIVTRILLATISIFGSIGAAELLNRRYEFDLTAIRHRHMFRWRMYPVPRSMKLFEDQGAIYFVDNDTRSAFLFVSREFTRAGSLIEELKDFYTGHGVAVFVEHDA